MKQLWSNFKYYMVSSWKKFLPYSTLVVGGLLLFILEETIRRKNTGFETKTLWDWMDLLIIPLFLAGGAFFLDRSEKAHEREIETDRQQEAALQAYLDRMADLLLENELLTTKNEEVKNVARTRTLTVLRGLDGIRKGIVISFLKEAGLINGNTFIDLKGADLTKLELRRSDLKAVNLRGVNLGGASLSQVDLSGTNLSEAYLGEASLDLCNLSGANLSKAVLTDASLFSADLTCADLRGAGLYHASLWGADLSGADLTGAYIDLTEQPSRRTLTGYTFYLTPLQMAKSIKGITMPDGTKHD
jgi:uncharacterized protein YjbI with pentapeptide repeats